jgi:hypothetical protein
MIMLYKQSLGQYDTLGGNTMLEYFEFGLAVLGYGLFWALTIALLVLLVAYIGNKRF